MFCKNYSADNSDNSAFCCTCGSDFSDTVGHGSVDTPDCMQEHNVEIQVNPKQYSPLSPWAYAGYFFLFSIPIVGFILLIVVSLNNDNINRRNFARAYWCVLLIFLSYISLALPYFIMLYIQKHI